MGAAHQPNRRGGCVLLMVSVQHQQQIERLADVGVHLVGLGRHREHHMQQV